MRRNFFTCFFIGLVLQQPGFAQMAARQPNPQLASQPTQGALRELFAGPKTSAGYTAWLDSMKAWRTHLRDTLAFSNSAYTNPKLDWTKSVFVYAQMMAHDRYFYDPVTGKYTVDKYLNDVSSRYGGLDAVLVWPTYPNIGIDDRNQLDYWQDMPGGLEGIKQMVQDFQARGVKVFFPIMIWDNGTRKLEYATATALIKAMETVGADGLNGDTMAGVTEDFKTASDSVGYVVAMQPEISIRNLKMLEWNTLSWGYFWNYDYTPGVSVYKWLEPGHQVQVTNRWAINKTNDLQYAFFNGVGYNAWENIWGIWNQVPGRYGMAIKRIRAIYQQFPANWSSPKWTPFIPVSQTGVFASVFPGEQATVYTFVNRDSVQKTGEQLVLQAEQEYNYYDLWNGQLLTHVTQKGTTKISFPLEPNGFGALLALKGKAGAGLKKFLTSQRKLAVQTLTSIDTLWKPLKQQLTPIVKTKPAATAPEGMVLIAGSDNYNFQSIGVMIEGNELPTAIGVQHPWEEHPSRSQVHAMSIPGFYMDVYPVTNQQFKKFMDATHYHPADDHNFLKDWHNGVYADGEDSLPVTWVSIEDGRAYAAWAGKRLPHEWEWQYAAQGNDGRLYPWGSADSTRIPITNSSRNMRKPTPVSAFEESASVFGIKDLVGNIWQWTDEYADDHTRSAILKGGSYYSAKGSRWYFPQAKQLNQYGKYLLMSPGLDRARTIGFRCVKDK